LIRALSFSAADRRPFFVRGTIAGLTSRRKGRTLSRVEPAPILQVHASCVRIGACGVLLCGGSGSGKSDLALRMIHSGASLVADDRVDLSRDGDALRARCPAPLAGLLEVRGLGLLRVPAIPEAPVGLAVDLVPGGGIERLPEPAYRDYLGIRVPLVKLDPFQASAAAKVAFAARAASSGDLFAR
jgi:serine kinase of HPr protein (carbohydrate metabolism regulator)